MAKLTVKSLAFVACVLIGFSFVYLKKAKATYSDQLAINKQVQQFIDQLPGHVYWKNTKGIYLGCNQQQADILAIGKPSNIIGKTIYDFHHDSKLADAIEDVDQKVMTTGEEIKLFETGLDEAGKPVTYVSYKKPITDQNNQVIGLIGISFQMSQ